MSSNLSSNFPQFNFGMAKANGHGIYEFDEFRLDVGTLMLYRRGEAVPLPPKAVKTLAVLVENQGEILSKDDLIGKVWEGSVVEESNLSQYLYLIRKILGSNPDGGPYIETLRRRGYRFTGKGKFLNGEMPAAQDVPTDSPNGRRHLERQGNVVALVDWKATEEPPAAIDPAANPERQTSRQTILKALLGVAVAVLVLSTAFGAYWFGRGVDEGDKVNGEMNFVRMTNGIFPRDATISPDGKYFVYHELNGDLYRVWLQQTGYSTRIEILPASERPVYDKTFSPDSQFVYIVAADSPDGPRSLYRVPTLGGPATKLFTGINSYVSFSPDGRELVFFRHDKQNAENAYVIRASDGSGDERILYGWQDEKFMGANPAWSPDGKLIVFGSTVVQGKGMVQCSLVAADVATGNITPISDDRWDDCYRTAWSPDGRGIYMIGTKAGDGMSTRRDQVYFISYPQGRSRRLTTEGNRHLATSLGVTKDGSVFAVPFNRSSQIWVMDPKGDSRTAVQITTGLADGRPGIAPLANGRVAYITRSGENLNIWSMNPDGSDQRQLTVDPPFVEEVRSSRDGRYLVFSGVKGGDQHLYRVDTDGSNMRQLTFGEGHETDSSMSNDGKWVVYGSTKLESAGWKFTLSKTPLDGGEPVSLNRGDCDLPHFSPDDKYVSCVRNQKEILILSADDGTFVRSFPTLPLATLNFGARWTPDGKAVVYIVSVNGEVSNLWLQPVDGGRPRRLTDFSSGQIYHFAYSLDGTRLFLARGQQISDAMLIKNSPTLPAR